MANWVDAIVSPLKAAGETAQKLIELRDTVKFGEAVIELQAQIMAAQQGAFAAHSREAAMAEEIADLKKRMAELEAWDAEKKRYKLHDFGSGTYACILKKGMENDDPPHRLCTNCFDKAQKSILHFQVHNVMSQDVYDCPNCKHQFSFGTPKEPPATVVESDYDPLDRI